MALKSYSASAPGSLMLFGEHAVLAGKPAIVCAIDKRLSVKLIPNTSTKLRIIDSKLGILEQELSAIQIQAPFTFVLSAISMLQDKIPSGFSLEINSNFSSTIGFGSSAAVTAATVAVLMNWLNGEPMPPKKLFVLAKQAIINVQGVGSGADLVASIYGGVLSYQLAPCKIIPLSIIPDLTAVYCGYKKPTKEVIAIVAKAKEQQPEVYAGIFNAMHTCVKRAIKAIKTGDWQALGLLFKQHHSLQNALGTSDNILESLIAQLQTQPEILGAKISGSGLGDCVIGLGTLNRQVFPYNLDQKQQGILQFPISVSEQGLLYAND